MFDTEGMDLHLVYGRVGLYSWLAGRFKAAQLNAQSTAGAV